jgi:rubrerythrin
MTLEKALREALEYEIRVRDVYTEAAGEIRDESGRKVIEKMASEEQEHVNYLAGLLRELKDKGVISKRAIPETLPDADALIKHVKVLRDRISGGNSSISEIESDVSMLNRAIEVERETSDFYQRMVDQMSDEYKDLFRRFLEIEKGHLAIVEAELDFLHGSGYWFDFPEFSLESE